MTITIPTFYENLLTNSPHRGDVLRATERVAEFVGDPTRGLPFFPEYTGHGVDHIERVLDATVSLIDECSANLVTPTDAVVIVCAALLHDSAMHLTEDGLLTLINSSADSSEVTAVDPHSWKHEWDRYFTEASRWDDRQLMRVIGDVTAEAESDLASSIRPLDELGSPEEWTRRDRKFLGEFIRRHHARLAHEFALSGVPGAADQPRVEILPIETDLADLAGFVARSHNMHLRDTFSYLEQRFQGRVICRGAHPVYLMVLLRIADYLQVESERAPSSSLRLRTLRNPISRAEWAVHECIREVRLDEHDCDAVFVVAEPNNVTTFLKARALLDGLQRELDLSWATLGEVYSRQDDLVSFAIRLRRVRSNLDDLDRFRQTVDYIPAAFAFDTAGAALLKRLVFPLYDGRPEIGIRELLQNAVDAINEFQALSDDALPPDEPAITLSLERDSEDRCWFTIEDRGIGMDEEVLRSYFFRAGASFRESDAWRRQFAKDGTPIVIRSGRFGIGVLAAFLLGEHIEVTTRHHRAARDDALSFTASIENSVVEVRRCVRAQPGTTIRIQLGSETYSQLAELDGREWDWYRWQSPRVNRVIDNNEELPLLTRIPEPGAVLSDQWHRLNVDTFQDVIWTFGPAPRLVCNGINIGTSGSSQGYSRQMDWAGESKTHDVTVGVGVPCVAITDRNGLLPINLQRFNLIKHRYPFANELMADVTRDFIAFCLVFAPSSVPVGEQSLPRHAFFDYPGKFKFPSVSFWPLSQWFYTDRGSGVQHWASLRSTEFERAKLIILLGQESRFPKVPLQAGEILLLATLDLNYRQMTPMAFSHILGRQIKGLGPHLSFFTEHDGVTIGIPKFLADGFTDYCDAQVDLRGLQHSLLDCANDQNPKAEPLAIWRLGAHSDRTSEWQGFDEWPALSSGLFIYAELERPRVRSAVDNAFGRTWASLMKDQIIPFEINERRDKFRDCYDELATFIHKWESLQLLGHVELQKRFQTQSPKGFNLRL